MKYVLFFVGLLVGSFGFCLVYDDPVNTVDPDVSVEQPVIDLDDLEIDETQKTFSLQFDCEAYKECRLLAEAIYFEARGEGREGMVAVGYVIMNRVKSPYFRNTVEGVIRHRCHFTYTCDGSINNGIKERDVWFKSLIVAFEVYFDLLDDPTSGANHYLNHSKVDIDPHWTFVYSQVAIIGEHTFYKR